MATAMEERRTSVLHNTQSPRQRPSVVKRVRIVADTIRAMHRMNSFTSRLKGGATQTTSGAVNATRSGPPVGDLAATMTGPRGQRGSGGAAVSMAAQLFQSKRKSGRSSLVDGGVVGAGRRIGLAREISVRDNDNERRKGQILRSKALLRKFRLVCRIAVFCARQAREHRLKDKLYDEIMPYVNEMRFHDYEAKEEPTERGLSFDPASYKADKQLRISEETKRVLALPPSVRTEKDLAYAQVALRNIHAIAQYPVRMQKKVVEVGRYEKYDAKRVIVRQGHPATAFYFILSGSVVVMVTDPETKISKPVAYLSKGTSFGELAIIQRTERQANIIAKETLELLSIDIKDFHRIFMLGGVKNLNDPDHDAFIRNLHFLKKWPLEKMATEPDKCRFFYFKQGLIVVRDSRRSDWLFVVKSGSLKVLKKLKRVEAFQWKNREANPPPKVKTEKEKKTEKEYRDKQRRHILPELKIPLREGECEIESLPELPPLTLLNEQDTNRTRRLNRWTTEHTTTDRSGAAGLTEGEFANPQSGTTLPELANTEGTQKIVRPLSWTSRSSSAKTNRANNEGHKSADAHQQGPSTVDTSITDSHSQPHGDGKKAGGKSKREEEQEEVEREMHGRKQWVRTIITELDAGSLQKPSELTEADLDPQFVHVQTLTKGQVFGLSELILGNQPSFCVVSNGAECILMDKQFYRTYASEELLRKVRNENTRQIQGVIDRGCECLKGYPLMSHHRLKKGKVSTLLLWATKQLWKKCCPYPTDDEMQEGLQASVDWEAYKNATFMDTLAFVSQKKQLNSPRSGRSDVSEKVQEPLLPAISMKGRPSCK